MFAFFLVTLAFSVLTAWMASSQKAQQGNLKDFTFPQIGDGDPLIYCFGRVKVDASGLVWYGNFRVTPIKQGSIFGWLGATVGYQYSLGWQLVICIGPNVNLIRIWFGNPSDRNAAIVQENEPNFTDPNDPKIPWPIFNSNGLGDDLNAGSKNNLYNASIDGVPANTALPNGIPTCRIFASDENAFGGPTGGGGYSLAIEFFSGNSDQPASTYLPTVISGAIPAWRGVSYATLDGYIGNTTSLNNCIFEIQRTYDPLGLGDMAIVGSEGDGNPANAIYELMTNNFGAASIPIAKINIASFIACGQTLYNEGNGISISFGGSGGSGTIKQVIQDCLRQIDGCLYENPLDGLIYLQLIRQDYVVADLPVISVSNIADLTNFGINLWSDTKNRIRVTYEDRDKWYEDRVAVGEDMANVNFQNGQVLGLNISHPYVKTAALANAIVAREMAIYSTPISKTTAKTQRFDLNLHPGSVVNFSFLPYGIDSVIMRLTKVNFGSPTSNALQIDMVQDKFAKTQMIFAPPSNSWARYTTGAANIISYITRESPRWMNLQQPGVISADNPRALAVPLATNGSQLSYNLWLRAVGEPSFTETNLAVPYAEVAHIGAAMAQEYSTASVPLTDISDPDAIQVVAATQIASLGTNLVMIDQEIMAFESYTQDPDTLLYTLTTIHRGLLDTTVAAHANGAQMTFLWTANHVGNREFADGQTIDLKMGSNAVSGSQTVDLATEAFI